MNYYVTIMRMLPKCMGAFVWSGLVFVSVGDAYAQSRRATIQWKTVPGAIRYDFQLSKSPLMDPLLYRKKIPSTRHILKLPSGTYYFRVRGLDEKNNPGPWTEVQGFTVNPRAPKPLEPRDKKVFKEEIPEEGLEFTWKEGIEGSTYLIEISDKRGVVERRSVSGTNYLWRPSRAGIYYWRIGFETQAGEEWGAKRVFGIRKKAIERPLPKIAEVDEGDIGETWLTPSIGQSVVAYSADDKDLSVNASAAALVGIGGLEFRWEQERFTTDTKRWIVMTEGQVFRQTILGVTFWLPRGHLRAVYQFVKWPWYFGPIFHAGAYRGSIFVVDDQGSVQKRTRLSRLSGGLGFSAMHKKPKALNFGVYGLGTFNTGGSMELKSNTLVGTRTIHDTIGFELGFRTIFPLRGGGTITGRIRILHESYNWDSLDTSKGVSSVSNTFIMLDVGYGFRL